MPIFFQYLFKLSISLAVVYLFYQVVLRRLTFHTWNRWCLLGYTVLSFLIPFINITPALQRADTEVISFIPVVEIIPLRNATATISSSMDRWDWTVLTVFCGMFILLIRLGVQCLSYIKIRKKAQLITNDGIKVYQVNEEVIPFSFGNDIFINKGLHTEEDLKNIIRHEFVHVKQHHTIDIIWSEVFCIINWYNPFAWLLRKSLRQNLEFIADGKVLENGIDKKEYQYLLLKVIGTPQFRIANQFNLSSLKKRIIMMNKIRSAKVHLIKFLFVLPVIAVLLIAFRHDKRNGEARKINDNIKTIIDTIPKPQPPEDYKEFLKRNPTVNNLHWNLNEIIIELKSGKIETYNLQDEKNIIGVEKKYGKLPIAPPPPLPPEANMKTNLIIDTIMKPHLAEDYKAFLKRNPTVNNLDWTLNEIAIELKSGKIETYNLHDEKSTNTVEKKYGKLPIAPPPPLQMKQQMQSLENEKIRLNEIQQFLETKINSLRDSLRIDPDNKTIKNVIDFLQIRINALKETSPPAPGVSMPKG